MWIFAVVGGIAAGKSTVCQILEKQGGVRLDADALGHEALRQEPIRSALRQCFGATITGPDGEIDRRILGRLVFGNPRQVAALNAIVHPEIARLLQNQIEIHKAKGSRFVLIDAALFLEANLGVRTDAVIAATAPSSVRRARLVARENLSESEITARFDSQPDVERWTSDADFRIDTQGSRLVLEERVLELWKSLEQTMKDRRSAGE